MGMSWAYGDKMRVAPDAADEREAIATLHRALELGVNFFDTAELYGPFRNEELVGRALRDRRDRVVIATKFGFRISESGEMIGVDSRPEHVREVAEASLQAARRRPHRSALPAPRRSAGADRGYGRRHGGAREGRQGPPSRPVGSGGATIRAPIRCMRSRPCRPSTRSGAASRSTRSCPSAASSASASSPIARSVEAS